MKQFIKFGIVGLFNSIINYIIYAICIKIGLHYVLANTIGFIIVIFIAYLLQTRFVFIEDTNGKQQVWWKILIKTYMSYAFSGLILTNILSFLWLDIFDLSAIIRPIYQLSYSYFTWEDEYTCLKYMVPFFNVIITMPINYIINKYWTYKQNK